MDDTVELEAFDIPQADSLPTIRRVVEAIDQGGDTNNKVAEMTGYSDRHVRYRMQAARILGFVSANRELTKEGERLIQTMKGSAEERTMLRCAIEKSAVVRIVVPQLLSGDSVDKDKVAKAIAGLTGLSQATAARRAQVLKSWARQLATVKDCQNG
jgi:hypothetical protein